MPQASGQRSGWPRVRGQVPDQPRNCSVRATNRQARRLGQLSSVAGGGRVETFVVEQLLQVGVERLPPRDPGLERRIASAPGDILEKLLPGSARRLAVAITSREVSPPARRSAWSW